jgi:hypothetical protein
MTVSSATWGTTSDVSLGEIRESTGGPLHTVPKESDLGNENAHKRWAKGGGGVTPCSLVGGWCLRNLCNVRNISVSDFFRPPAVLNQMFIGPSHPVQENSGMVQVSLFIVSLRTATHGMSRRMQAFCDFKLRCSGTPQKGHPVAVIAPHLFHILSNLLLTKRSNARNAKNIYRASLHKKRTKGLHQGEVERWFRELHKYDVSC